MSDITATLRVESPDLALTETVAYDETATVQPVSGAGTVPNLGAYLFEYDAGATVFSEAIAGVKRGTGLYECDRLQSEYG